MKKSPFLVQKLTVFVLLCAIAMTGLPLFKVSASGTITGRVFQDFNGNGTYDTVGSTAIPAIDAGIAGVTVTAYDSAGVSQGSTATIAAGTYSLSATGTGPYRLEFTTLPSGYFASSRSTDSVSGGTATNAGSTVQFVADGTTSDVNLALNRASDYSQNNPNVALARIGHGNPTDASNATIPAVYQYPYSTSGNTPNAAILTVANAPNVGSIWGMAWNKYDRSLYSAALLKRHTGLGVNGVGAVYRQTDITNPSSVSLFYDFGAMAGSVANNTTRFSTGSGSTGTYTGDNIDSAVFNDVGKMGLGDIELSENASALYVSNLADRKVYSVNTSGTPVATEIGIAPWLSNSICTNGTARVWGLKEFRGNLYAGVVCDGSAALSGGSCNLTSACNALTAHVYQYNGSAWSAFITPFSLNYQRDKYATGGNGLFWHPWVGGYADMKPHVDLTVNGNVVDVNFGQPIITDLAFETDGSLIMSLGSRTDNQLGYAAPAPDAATAGAVNERNFSNGDILRFYNNAGTQVLENNGVAGPLTGTGSALSGPGGIEFYNDRWNWGTGSGTTDDSAIGGMAVFPGTQQVIFTESDARDAYSAGTVVHNNTNGAFVRVAEIYDETSAGPVAKAGGLGDLELLVDSAPIEIGNRVWEDVNGNGVQDAGESSLAEVTVHLYNSANAVIATAVTDTNGEYYFTSGTAVDPTLTDNIGIVNGQITPNTNYQVRLDNPSDYTGGNPLNGKYLTTLNQATQNGFDEGSDSDASNVVNPTGSPSGTYPVVNVLTGSSGDNNHNIDVGFAPFSTYSIGNRVWYDTNSNGQIDAPEVGISGVSVSLFDDSGCLGTPDNPNSPLQTLTTDVNGYYRFDGLTAGCYFIRINPVNFGSGGVLEAYQSTAGNNSGDAESFGASSNAENGIDPSSINGTNSASKRLNGVWSNLLVLSGGTEPTSEADVAGSGSYAGQGATDNQADMTVDFGFYEMCLCGTVWLDTGAGGGGNNNGIQAGTEAGISGVRVRVYDNFGVEIPVGADGILGTADDGTGGVLTDGTGTYRFRGLTAGSYRVVVIASPTNSSTPTNTNDDLIDLDDNGAPGAGAFAPYTVSPIVVLTPRFESGFNDADGTTANVTVDFGFIAAPTAVKMETFDVVSDGKLTVVTWETGAETNNLGFNVYREVDGNRELLTKSPIAGSALRGSATMEATGEAYRFIDRNPSKGAVYFVEDLDLSGNSTFHGSIAPRDADTSKFGASESSKSLESLESLESGEFGESIETVGSVGTKSKTSKLRNAKNAINATNAINAGAKFHVKRDGWYRVSAANLATLGFSGDTTNWTLSRNGEEVPMRLAADNSLEFYGQAADKLTTNTQVYYLSTGDVAGKRLNISQVSNADDSIVATSFNASTERKDRSIYLSFLLNGEKENWFGPVISPTALTNQTLTVNNPAQSDFVTVKVRLQGLTNNTHAVRVLLNNLEIGTVSYGNYENKVAEFEVPSSQVLAGANQVSLQSVSANDYSVVDSVKISYRREFRATNNFLRFNAPANQAVKFGGFTGDFELFEVVNGVVSEQVIPQEADTKHEFLISAASREREFIALSSDQTLQPALAEVNNPSNLKFGKNKADFVIIAPEVLKSKAESLAAVRTSQGLLSKVVLVEDIYDEFSFGSHDPQAIKDFLKFATTNWNVKPSFALLFGDSSADYKGYTGVSRDLVPTKLIDTVYLETSSDSWLADFNNDDIEDIAIGRLPVFTDAEANVVLAKLNRYDAQPTRQQFKNVIVTDKLFESYANTLQSGLPASLPTTRLDRSVLSDSAMRQAITENLNANPFIVTYYGHGSVSNWTEAPILRGSEAANLNNNQLGLYLLMTCLNGYSHSHSSDGMAESLLKAENGGAIAVWASSGMTIADYQLPMSQAIYQQITNSTTRQLPRLGSILKAAKSASNDPDVKKPGLSSATQPSS